MAEPTEDQDDYIAPESAPPTVEAPELPSKRDATQSPTSTTKLLAQRHAFIALMVPKLKAPHLKPPVLHQQNLPSYPWRLAPISQVTIHLLPPRSPTHYFQHPHTAFADPVFLATIRSEAASAAQRAAAELARQLGSFSAINRARNKATDCVVLFSELPLGQDHPRAIRVGTHAHLSMGHLYVHIFSRDSRSERGKDTKHYNSFHTPFLVLLAEYPLAEDDVRWETGFRMGI
ncbi:hypothetical protein VTI74DRAFT_5312 [Chaetomium olivicolor]